jgi:predicted nucleic acid-binding protein
VSSTDPASSRIAVLDACSLVPIRLATTLLWLAEAGVFELLWSDAILDEVQRNLPKLGVTEQKAARRVATMHEAFGAAALVDGYEHLIPEMTCDAKDRHVLAAAVHGEADTLVTFNLKDFPEVSTAEHGIDVVHPDAFLTRLLAERSSEVITALSRGTADLHNPTQTLIEFLASLTSTVPIFANLTADVAASPPEAEPPIAALMSADEDEAVAAFGEPGDLTNPAQVAFVWWSGIISNLELARVLTFDPSAWGDFQWAIDLLADKSLASKVLPAVDAPGRLVFMRFVPEVASTSQVFSSYVTAATFVTLIRVADGTWRVWGLGAGIPAAKYVLGDPEFVPGGGTGLVFDWLTRIAEPSPPAEVIWGSLDAPLRLAMAQSWLLGTGHVTADDPQRDTVAEQLSAVVSSHPLFEEFYRWLVAHYQHVYRAIDGKPCLVGATETGGLDLELVMFASEEHAGPYEAGVSLPVHTFITRHVGDGEWVIAANARRMPVPGWPPTEQVLPRVLIDGN